MSYVKKMKKNKKVLSREEMEAKLIAKLPETAEIFAGIRADEAAGLAFEPCQTARQCQTWKDAWVYIFYRAHHYCSHFLQFDGEKVVCVVLIGPEFKDKLLGLLEKMAERIGVNNDLKELRLIETEFTPGGIERLKAILPKASFNYFTRQEADQNRAIKYVNTRFEWIKELQANK